LSYKSFNYQCDFCGIKTIELVDRTELPKPVSCLDCDGMLIPQLGAPMVMNASFPDGTKRFTTLKEQRKLKKLKTDLKKSGNRVQEKLVDKEIQRHKEATKK